MIERPRPAHYPPNNFETTVDRLIRSGQHLAAQELLSANLQEVASIDRNKYHHLAIKNATLPLYEIIQNGVTPESDQNIDTALGTVGSLLKKELDYFIHNFDNPAEHGLIHGRLSELTVLHLIARDKAVTKDVFSPILVPAPRAYDVEKDGFGVDFLLTTANGSLYDGYLAQVKTVVTKKDREYYAPYINLVGMNELDPENYGWRITHPKSLTKRLLREQAGTATPEDIECIEDATSIFYDKMAIRITDNFAAHPTKPGWVQPMAA